MNATGHSRIGHTHRHRRARTHTDTHDKQHNFVPAQTIHTDYSNSSFSPCNSENSSAPPIFVRIHMYKYMHILFADECVGFIEHGRWPLERAALPPIFFSRLDDYNLIISDCLIHLKSDFELKWWWWWWYSCCWCIVVDDLGVLLSKWWNCCSCGWLDIVCVHLWFATIFDPNNNTKSFGVVCFWCIWLMLCYIFRKSCLVCVCVLFSWILLGCFVWLNCSSMRCCFDVVVVFFFFRFFWFFFGMVHKTLFTVIEMSRSVWPGLRHPIDTCWLR